MADQRTQELKAAQYARHRASMERATAAIGDDGKTAWQRRWEQEFAHRWVMTSTGLRLRSEVEKERAK